MNPKLVAQQLQRVANAAKLAGDRNTWERAQDFANAILALADGRSTSERFPVEIAAQLDKLLPLFAASYFDAPGQVGRHGAVLRIDLWYPPRRGGALGASNAGNATHIEVGLCDVRAADSIRISYDFDRDGYVIEQDAFLGGENETESQSDWQEVSFVKAWAREKPANSSATACHSRTDELESALRPARPDDLGQGATKVPLGFFDDVPFMYEFTDANGPMRCHPASGVGPLTLHMKRPYVATLPDGTRVNLPAGTVLRDDKCANCGGTGRVETPEDGPEKCHECYGHGSEAMAEAYRARDLLRETVTPLEETGSADVLAAVNAFLAGETSKSKAVPEPSPLLTPRDAHMLFLLLFGIRIGRPELLASLQDRLDPILDALQEMSKP